MRVRCGNFSKLINIVFKGGYSLYKSMFLFKLFFCYRFVLWLKLVFFSYCWCGLLVFFKLLLFIGCVRFIDYFIFRFRIVCVLFKVGLSVILRKVSFGGFLGFKIVGFLLMFFWSIWFLVFIFLISVYFFLGVKIYYFEKWFGFLGI